MTTPVGGTRHTGVSSRRSKGSKLAVYGIFLMMSLVWYTNTFFTYFCFPSRLGTNFLRLSLDLVHHLSSF